MARTTTHGPYIHRVRVSECFISVESNFDKDGEGVEKYLEKSGRNYIRDTNASARREIAPSPLRRIEYTTRSILHVRFHHF